MLSNRVQQKSDNGTYVAQLFLVFYLTISELFDLPVGYITIKMANLIVYTFFQHLFKLKFFSHNRSANTFYYAANNKTEVFHQNVPLLTYSVLNFHQVSPKTY